MQIDLLKNKDVSNQIWANFWATPYVSNELPRYREAHNVWVKMHGGYFEDAV